MTFLEIQNEVLERFNGTTQARIKNWINFRYGRIWATAPWTFKRQWTNVTIPVGATSVSLTTEGDIISVWDSTYSVSGTYSTFPSIRPEDAYNQRAFGYTVVGNTLYFPYPATRAYTLTVLSDKAFVPLANDGDIPLIPAEFHRLLVLGALSEGQRWEGDPAWQATEDEFRAGIEDMKQEYLTNVQTYSDSYPSWP